MELERTAADGSAVFGHCACKLLHLKGTAPDEPFCACQSPPSLFCRLRGSSQKSLVTWAGLPGLGAGRWQRLPLVHKLLTATLQAVGGENPVCGFPLRER